MNRSTTEFSRMFCALLAVGMIGTLAGCKSNRNKGAAAPAHAEFAEASDEFGAPISDAAMEAPADMGEASGMGEVTDAEAIAAAGEAAPAVAQPRTMAPAPDGTMMPVIQGFARPDGLGIEDMKLGDGEVAASNSVVTIRYHGTLSDGTVVDSTRGKKAAKFPLAKLIQGWQMGVPGMKVGGIRRLTVPPYMAYGEKGLAKAGIPGNATLTYSIELVDVHTPVQANVER